MTTRGARRALWLALVLVAPVPILALGQGAIPVAKYLVLMAAAAAIIVTESARGALPMLMVVFGLQALGYTLIHGAVAWLFTRFTPPAVGFVVAAGLGVGGVWAWTSGFYDDPFQRMAVSTFPGQSGEPEPGFDPASWHPAPEPEPDPEAGLPFVRTEWREPCDAFDPDRQLFWGDTHIHTSYSFDAWGQGTRNTPRDAYRFAQGEPLGVQPWDASGQPLRTVRLDRPLDFTLLSDHAEVMGEVRICQTPGLPGHDTLPCRLARRWPLLGYAVINSQMMDETDPVRYGFCGEDGAYCRETARRPWQEIQEAAEEAYDRTSACRFTSFVGFEWSGNPDSSMIHRNVLFRNEVVPQRLSNYVDDRTNRAFWEWLDEACLAQDGRCDALVIPHNSNLGNGRLFPLEMEDGSPLSREYAELRARLERLLEVTQHKGDSECREGADPLCDFETLAFGRMMEQATPWQQTEPAPRSYAREILGAGLVEQARLGVNPFKLGLAGATDTHLGTPGLVDEQRFPGHGAGVASARLEIPPLPDDVRFNPGGLQAVWAEENSRDSLFAAMHRRETYGTSGPRMVVRSFTGWDLPDDLCQGPGFARRGYALGVPMGGDLAGPAEGRAPAIAVIAQRDPGTPDRPGAKLQRIQVVKLWEEDGEARQRVYDVAGDPDNGARVEPYTCQPSGPGFDDLCSVWRDPDFDPARHAAWYVRVVENPTCRWNAWACNAHGVRCEEPATAPGELVTCCDPDVPRTIQERAWTSPVWYTPE